MPVIRESSLDKAIAAWGENMPDTVAALAAACDQSSQNQVAKKIGRSPAAISQVISNQYKGDMMAVLSDARAFLNDVKVLCPVLGNISKLDCKTNSNKDLSTASPLDVRLWKTCRNCKYNEGK